MEDKEQTLIFSPFFFLLRGAGRAGLPAGSSSVELLGRGNGSSSSFLSAPVQRELLVELLTRT